MNRFFLLIVTFFLFTVNIFANDFIQTKIDNHLVKIIKYDRFDENYKLKFAVNQDYDATNLRELLNKNNAISGINGVFLCPADYYECGGKNFTHNERYFEGKKYARDPEMGDRVLFALDSEGKGFLYKANEINSDREDDIYYGLANFPLILHAGESGLGYYEEVGIIDRKMKASGTRNFICTDRDRRYIFTGFVYTATMYEMPDILKELGCYDALNLDAGNTSSLIYNGRQIITERRKMLDAVVVEQAGFDVASTNKLIDATLEKFENRLQNIYLEERIQKIESIIQDIHRLRNLIYNDNSKDLFDEEGQKIGYHIHMKKKKSVVNMYVINTLESGMKKLLWKYKQEQKELQDSESLLF